MSRAEINNNDVSGSKMLVNFCDSAFAIGKSCKDESIRYVKQIKERNCGKVYGEENVCIAELSKINDNFLCFDFIGYGNEKEHLLSADAPKRQAEIDQAITLKKEGKSQRQTAEIIGVSVGKVNKLLKEGESQDSPTVNSGVHFVHNSEDLNKMNILELEGFPC